MFNKQSTFIKRFQVDSSVEEAFQWHAREGAIERLSPPWDPLKIIRRSGGIRSGAEVVMKLKMGPIPYTWQAEHTSYVENELFRDEQRKGPFSKWIHTHRFAANETGGCEVEDHIEYKLPFHFLSHLFAQPLILKKLGAIFDYRHRTTQQDLSLHNLNRKKEKLTFLISGATGVIGSALVPFLTTGGHRVIKLVRNRATDHPDEISWDPMAGRLDLNPSEKIDAIIHLAGENIGSQRWSETKKKKIIDSRNLGTALMAEKISRLQQKPRVFLCASAIGYYGDRGEQMVTEQDGAGDDFISDVCTQWERSTDVAVEAGIRTAFLRIGVVLTPLGGALARLLLPFQLGMGTKIASGKQYVSWISMPDVLGSIYSLVFNEALSGPINIVSPKPCTNLELSKTLAKVLHRPVFFRIPETLIKSLFGQMGREVLLSSTRVQPQVLLDSHYQFLYPDLEQWLLDTLGLTS